MDLSEALTHDAGALINIQERIFTAGATMTKPIVAAVHGAALAGGLGLVANCHIVVAAEGASFGLTEIRIGLWPFVIFRSVAAAIGERRTIELALTGQFLGPNEAREYGLVHYVVDAESLLARAREIAVPLSQASPTAIQSGLTYVRKARGKNWTEAGTLAREIREDVFRSADFQEGVHAFQEKRPPRWPSLG
jgi:enoyl-CoA hydratase/carnithine racemase